MTDFQTGDACAVAANCKNYPAQCLGCYFPEDALGPTQYIPRDKKIEHPWTTQRKAERKAQRKQAKQSDASKRGKRNKRNGYRSEKDAEHELARFGFHRVPLSGALEGQPGDIRRDVPDGRMIRMIENKRRVGAMGYIEDWLAQEGADAIRLDAGGRRKPLIILPLDRFEALLDEAGYDVSHQAVKNLPDLLREAADQLERR
ncbi:hypothetical protein [Sulfobacillus harzensis]|uniref:Uncharacterized protein n=1 Tax=Sulfobacillus harzensis TaxID=2729629 RepID=A0A7Y0L5X1_9FIRM|nr:hypothetical protein [Sulfobacillus harzensis]NMP23811.1 hypothetical protein [Sulfobacillus harzensis]